MVAKVYGPEREAGDWQSFRVWGDTESKYRWVCEWKTSPPGHNRTLGNYNNMIHLDTGNVVLYLI
jgi:hypothetical protein